ncbi:hypothetical protein BDN72DRAFT_865950 [Pluteus cervinus]|uniref:Uncharacterized protein n=1 Tax=Pluteus cervinus TaxID=181527 RepID=A0ACD2ZYK7_9AGAR|nr:hypothetical protein BDN72DRAFT_865950 [Pluteus cervinus]
MVKRNRAAKLSKRTSSLRISKGKRPIAPSTRSLRSATKGKTRAPDKVVTVIDDDDAGTEYLSTSEHTTALDDDDDDAIMEYPSTSEYANIHDDDDGDGDDGDDGASVASSLPSGQIFLSDVVFNLDSPFLSDHASGSSHKAMTAASSSSSLSVTTASTTSINSISTGTPAPLVDARRLSRCQAQKAKLQVEVDTLRHALYVITYPQRLRRMYL